MSPLPKLVPENPPPGPFRPTFWRSPLRGPWLTTIIGSLLLIAMTIVIVSGFLSHAAYEPDLARNAIVPADRDLPLNFTWPTSPSWLYALTQGLHVNVGLVALPLLLAKLWSVIPRLFAWPPAATPAQAIERGAIALLVGSALFQFATGVVNFQIYYPFQFNFVVAHYYGAVVFTAALAIHIVVKLPTMRRAWRERGGLAPLRESLAQTRPEPAGAGDLAPVAPAAPTISRRGLLGLVGGGSLVLLLGNVGQTIGGPLRSLSIFAPRRQDFPVNKTAGSAAVTREMVGSAWRLQLEGPTPRTLRRDDLLAMELFEERLPIACVEGWTTTQRWTGVRLRDLAAMAGAPEARSVLVESVQPAGTLRAARLNAGQLADERSLLALRVGGEDLSLDHGFPARVIVPALPGVHCTKWVGRMTFEA